jgi:hypothetical protein
MKLKLTETAKREIEEYKSLLEEALKHYTAANKELSALTGRYDELTAQIEKAEATTHGLDKAGILSLAELKTQREFLSGQLERNSGGGTPLGEELHHLLKGASTMLPRLLKPTQDALELEVAKVFRPYFSTVTAGLRVPPAQFALFAARGTHYCQQFGGFTNQKWGIYGPSIPAAKKLLALFDTILKGEVAFEFDPKLELDAEQS